MDASTNGGNFSVLLVDVVLSYFYGFQPLVGRNDKGQETRNYCTHAIMKPGHPGIELVKEAQRKAAKFKWGDQWQTVLNQLALQHRVALHDGALKGGEGYDGNFYVSANSKVRPRILVTRNGVNVDIAETDPCAPYSGARGNVMVDIWPQQHAQYGKRINAQFTGVQFTAHGQRFGGGKVAKLDEFGLAPTDADGPAPGGASAGADSSVSSLV